MELNHMKNNECSDTKQSYPNVELKERLQAKSNNIHTSTIRNQDDAKWIIDTHKFTRWKWTAQKYIADFWKKLCFACYIKIICFLINWLTLLP